MEQIANAKNVVDRYEHELDMLKDNETIRNQEHAELADYVSKTTKERDYYR